jgi:hypothetical protein
VCRVGRPSSAFDTLLARVSAVVGGWKPGEVPELPAVLREELVRELTVWLVDPHRREADVGRLRSARAELVGGTRPLTSRTSAGFSVEEFAACGIGGLSDAAVAGLALDPLHLEATAELIDHLAEVGALGRPWWDAMARAGSAAYHEADPGVLSPAAAVAPPPDRDREIHPASDWQMPVPVRE